MTDACIREYLAEDGPQLISLWSRVFGDPPELAAAFFRLLPELGTCCVAERDGRILGAAYMVTAFTLQHPGFTPVRCGYLYAVAVEEAARGQGLGELVSRGAAALGREAGAEILTTLPAEESLYAWYERILRLGRRSTRVRFQADALPQAERISAETYAAKRVSLLKGRAHMVLSPAALRFEQLLCEQYGGGFFSAGNTLFCAYRDEGQWLFPELLVPAGEAPAIPGLRAEELPYVCSDRPLPEGLIWNLTFD